MFAGTRPADRVSSSEALASPRSRWDDRAFIGHMENFVWTASPVVRRYLHLLVSGHPDCDWVTWVEWKHLPPVVERSLVLGCGTGWLERGMAIRGRHRSIVACDFAPETIDRARAEAERLGFHNIEYRILDLERDSLGGPYDAIFANDVLHHITDLEGVYARIHDALVPGGKLLFNEYVGPNRFQYSDDRMDLVNRYFRLIPDELRRDSLTHRVTWRRERCDAAQLIREDPTEAVRSEDVLRLARVALRTEREYVYGGGLLNPLLYGIVANFREDVPRHGRLLQALCDAEARLTETGVLESDFAVYVGVRPEA
jgi:SAM-dependent methyltransferase